MDLGIHLINSGSYQPRTNGKPERPHKTPEAELGRHDGLDDVITYYSGRRLHWSLDIDDRQTPLKAFGDETAYETIRADNPNWMGLTSWMNGVLMRGT